MAEYTPTLRTLRVAWVASAAPESTAEVHRLQAMFDRAVAAHDREVEARLRADYGLRSVADVERAAAEKAEAERDRIRAAVDAVRTLTADVGNEHTGPTYVGCYEVRAALDEHLGED